MRLPSPIQTYFDADQGDDAGRLADAFASDATVTDEGELYSGRPQIAAWWRAAKDRYQHNATPLDLQDAAGVTTVRATVAGNFPGSPAILTFAFRVRGDAIAHLEIGA